MQCRVSKAHSRTLTVRSSIPPVECLYADIPVENRFAQYPRTCESLSLLVHGPIRWPLVPVIDLGVHNVQTSVKTYGNQLPSRNQILAMLIVTNLVGCILLPIEERIRITGVSVLSKRPLTVSITIFRICNSFPVAVKQSQSV